MTPIQLYLIIIISYICLGVIIGIILYKLDIDLDIMYIAIFFIVSLVAISVFLIDITNKDVYFSNLYEIDQMMDSIEIQNFTEKTKYISPEEEPYDELEHDTLFGTESWKLTHYIHKMDNYDRFKKSNNSE